MAIFFDKPEFLKFLPQLRKDYCIRDLVEINDYYQVIDYFQDSKLTRLNLIKYKNAKELIKYARTNNTGYEDIEDEMDTFQLLETEASLLCYIFKRPLFFAEPIKQAILCHAVNDDYFKTTSFDVVEHDTLLSTAGGF